MEISCDKCNFIFNDKQLYDIHINLSKCSSNNSINDKNNYKYYCPVCDRQFRLLTNLQRHQETIKHQELLESSIKECENMPVNMYDDNIKNIFIDLTPRRKELTIEEMNQMNFDKLNMNNEDNDDVNGFNLDQGHSSNLDELFGNTILSSSQDTQDAFLTNLDLMMNEKDKDTNKDKEIPLSNEINFICTDTKSNNIDYNDMNINNTSNNNGNNNGNNNDDDDIFLLNLKRQRGMCELPKIHSPVEEKKINKVDIIKRVDDLNLQVNNQLFNVILKEDEPLDLSLEIEKTKLELNTSYDEVVESKEDDDFLFALRKNRNELKDIENMFNPERDQKNKNIKLKPAERSREREKEKKKSETMSINQKYPSEFKNHPIWIKLVETITECDKNKVDGDILATRYVVLLFVNMALADYITICTFVYYSEDLDNKLPLRINMIKAMIEVYNNYIKMANNNQYYWNNKDIMLAVNIMSKWKLDLFLNKMIKESKLKEIPK
jgi:hypothetical protein